jgi:hypothetical protein
MKLTMIGASLVIGSISLNAMNADRYYEWKMQMRGDTDGYHYTESNKRTITLTVTNPQYSLFQRMTIQCNGHATYETLASIISSRLFADGELLVRRDERNFKDVSTSRAQHNATDDLYFISRGKIKSSFELTD